MHMGLEILLGVLQGMAITRHKYSKLLPQAKPMLAMQQTDEDKQSRGMRGPGRQSQQHLHKWH